MLISPDLQPPTELALPPAPMPGSRRRRHGDHARRSPREWVFRLPLFRDRQQAHPLSTEELRAWVRSLPRLPPEWRLSRWRQTEDLRQCQIVALATGSLAPTALTCDDSEL